MKYDILLSDLKCKAKKRVMEQIKTEREQLVCPALLGEKIVIGTTCEPYDFLYLKG